MIEIAPSVLTRDLMSQIFVVSEDFCCVHAQEIGSPGISRSLFQQMIWRGFPETSSKFWIFNGVAARGFDQVSHVADAADRNQQRDNVEGDFEPGHFLTSAHQA